MNKRLRSVAALILLAFVLTGGAALAYEEPAYEILEQREGYEVRRYDAYIVAETVVEDDFKGAGNQAFRRLFGYISGTNRSAEKMEMTIPVVATTPVERVDGPASYSYYFVMPARYTLETLPVPDDPRIVIREVPARTVAVLHYSGRSNESNYRAKRDLLLQALRRDGEMLAGEPVFAVYNGPFTPWFLRRNEVMADLQQGTKNEHTS